METITINAIPRSRETKNSASQARAMGQIPCVLYGGDTNLIFSTTPNDVKSIIYTPAFKLAEIHLDGAVYKCIVKDVQFHPVTDEIIHLDFLQLEEGKPVKVNIPVKFKGESPGLKSGGKLIKSIREVSIKTVPEHLVDELYVDITGVELGQTVRIRDLELKEDIEVLNDPGSPIATIEVPRALKSATAAEEELLEAAEPSAEVE